MSTNTKLRVRVSILDLQKKYELGDKKPLENLMRAWKGIKALPADDPKSFFKLGGFHGEPFRGAGWGFGDNTFWGGYCNHGNVLFPTWHRVYLVKLEEALQSIAGCGDVMLPFWDETDEYSLANGIPWALTVENFNLDGVDIPNPLRSFTFPVTITDNVSVDGQAYSKPKGYTTVRYPLSGLVGNAAAQAQTTAHNSQYPDYNTNVGILNENIKTWLNTDSYQASDGTTVPAGIHQNFIECLNAPNYTVFSNTTSQQEWNETHEKPVVALESPHNDIHLSVGGYDMTSLPADENFDASYIADANGDMGENDTAALDPIFYFHHCNIDRVFWLWQKKWGKTNSLDIIPYYPGTNSSDNQGATPGVPPNTWLSLESPLAPFTKTIGGKEKGYTSMDCIDIENQLGYTYGHGSLENLPAEAALTANGSHRSVHISGINKAALKGSFVIAAFAKIDGKEHLIGRQSVLSRWAISGCANCQTHLEVKAAFSIQHLPAAIGKDNIYTKVLCRRQVNNTANITLSELKATAKKDAPLIKHNLEIR